MTQVQILYKYLFLLVLHEQQCTHAGTQCNISSFIIFLCHTFIWVLHVWLKFLN